MSLSSRMQDMMFGVPSLERMIALATIPPLIGFTLINRWGETWWGIMSMLFMDFGSWYAIYMYLQFMFEDYKRTPSDKTHDIMPLFASKQIPAAQVYETETESGLKWNAEKQFALTLVQQHAGKFKIDMTETYWLKGGRWRGTQEEFRVMLWKWDHYQITGRTHAHARSGREVLNWNKVRRIAAGERLPLPHNPLPLRQ